MGDTLCEVVVAKDVPIESCGDGDCGHTVIKHGNHIGCLLDGQLLCKDGNTPLGSCNLDVNKELRCQLVEMLDDHVHGPSCGHEVIPHGDHYDYLVGSRLHHKIKTSKLCCEMQCLKVLKPGAVVDHGEVCVLKESARFHAGESPRLHEDLSELGPEATFAPKAVKRKGMRKRERGQPMSDTVPLLSDEELVDGSEVEDVTTVMNAGGICCPSEATTIHELIGGLPGITSVEVMVLTKTVKVVHNPTLIPPTVLLSALNEAGLQASLGRKSSHSESDSPYPWHVILSGVCLAIALTSVLFDKCGFLELVAVGAIICGIPYILLRGYAALKQCRLDINILLIISVTGAVAISQYLEAGAIVFLFGFSEWLEEKCMSRARDSINFLMELQPEVAMSATTGKSIPADEVVIGDLLLVRPGDRVAVDGVVVSGESGLDESMLTGETKPVAKSPGDQVISGSVNSGFSSLKIRAEKSAADSTISQLAAKVEEASLQKSRASRLVEDFAKYYTPAVFFGAVLLAGVPYLLNYFDVVPVGNPSKWFYLALVLLVCACPCAVVISTPVVSVAGISRAARQSVLIKGGQYLEALADVKAITFDKTGTLTEGRFGIISMHAFNGNSEDDVLRLAASLELHSTHPLGPAIVGSAVARGISRWSTVSAVEVVSGKGIRGVVDGLNVSVGNHRLVKEDAPECLIPNISVMEGGSICYVVVAGRVVGALVVSDSIRRDAKETVQKLKEMGIAVGMLTGDRWMTAKVVAQEVGLFRSHTHADLLPDDKLELVAEYQDTFKSVAHIGDGVNDAPALASADVGVAMGVGGSAMAVEAADVALFSNDLMNLPFVFALAKCARRKLIQNIVFAVVTKLLVIVLAVLGYAHLWEAVVADVGSSLLVTLNGLSILSYERGLIPKQGGHHHGEGCCKKTQQKGCCGTSHKSTSPHSHAKKSHGGCCKTPQVDHSHSDHCGKTSHKHGASCCKKPSKPDVSEQGAVGKSMETSKKGCCTGHGHSAGKRSEVTSTGCCKKKHEGCGSDKKASHCHSHTGSSSENETSNPASGGCCRRKSKVVN